MIIIRDSIYLFLAFEVPSEALLDVNKEGADVYYAGVISSIGFDPTKYGFVAITKIFKMPIGAYITYTLIFTQEQKNFSDPKIRVDRGGKRKNHFNANISSPFSHKHRESDFSLIYIYMSYTKENTTNVFLKFEGTGISKLTIDYTSRVSTYSCVCIGPNEI